MKILFVSLFLPMEKAYHAGGRYVYELIKNLSLNHEIYLATRLEETETPYLENLKVLCRAIYSYTYRTVPKRSVIDVVRLVLNYIGFSRYANKLTRDGAFDIIQVEWIEAALMMKKGKAPMVLDAHDVITKPAERSMRRSQGIVRLLHVFRHFLMKTVELRIVRRFDMIFTLSDYDRKYLLDMNPRLRVQTVPIPAGMDITDRIFERDENTILFLASYKYRKVNVDAALWFYRSVFPRVREAIPEARFVIAGYGPPEELTTLPARDSNVTVTGFVEDIDEVYKKATVFVAPILVGGGIIVKILDAMAAGTPVVTTSYGNEGIGAKPGRDLLIADDPESFASAVINILRDEGLAEDLGKNARAFVRKNFSREATRNKIEAAYKDLINSSHK